MENAQQHLNYSSYRCNPRSERKLQNKNTGIAMVSEIGLGA